MGTYLLNCYWFFDVAVERILQSKYLQKYENNPDYRTYRHSILHIKVNKPVDLTARIQVDLRDRVEPVKVNQLLEQQRRSYLRFYHNRISTKSVYRFRLGVLQRGVDRIAMSCVLLSSRVLLGGWDWDVIHIIQIFDLYTF
jgi:hypothetical protein